MKININDIDLETLGDIGALSEYLIFIISRGADIDLRFALRIYIYVLKSLTKIKCMTAVDQYYCETYYNYRILYQPMLELNSISI